MANLQNIRRRIKSVKNIQKITNAMDMIARSRFNAARDALLNNIPYVAKTKDIMRRVMAQMRGQEFEHPFVMTRDELIAHQHLSDAKFLFIVIAADKGLAGSFASNVFKAAHDTIEYDGSDDAPANDDADDDDENFHKKNFDALKNVKPMRSTKQGKQFTAQGGIAKANARSGGGTGGNIPVARQYHDADYIDGVEIITVGRKATTHFKQRGYNIIKAYHGRRERPQDKYAKKKKGDFNMYSEQILVKSLHFCTCDFEIGKKVNLTRKKFNELFAANRDNWRWVTVFPIDYEQPVARHFFWLNGHGWFDFDAIDEDTRKKIRLLTKSDYEKALKYGKVSY